jgi:hypothetical protein
LNRTARALDSFWQTSVERRVHARVAELAKQALALKDWRLFRTGLREVAYDVKAEERRHADGGVSLPNLKAHIAQADSLLEAQMVTQEDLIGCLSELNAWNWHCLLGETGKLSIDADPQEIAIKADKARNMALSRRKTNLELLGAIGELGGIPPCPQSFGGRRALGAPSQSQEEEVSARKSVASSARRSLRWCLTCRSRFMSG